MKKAILLFLLTTSVNAQEIIRPASAYYSADSIRNRTDLTRAIMDGVIKWKDSNFVEMELPVYQPTLYLRFPKVDIPSGQLQETQKDTTVWGWSKIRLNKLRRIAFTYRTKLGGYDYETVHLKVLDTTIFRSCPETDFCSRDSMQFNIRRYYKGGQLQQDADEISDFKIEYYFERQADSSEVRTQTYANKPWHYYAREADTVEELLTLPFVLYSTEPGDGLGDPGTEGYQGEILRRHSKTFTKKYFQIRGLDPETGYIINLEIQNNEYK